MDAGNTTPVPSFGGVSAIAADVADQYQGRHTQQEQSEHQECPEQQRHEPQVALNIPRLRSTCEASYEGPVFGDAAVPTVHNAGVNGSWVRPPPPAVAAPVGSFDDELNFCTPADKVQELTEQIAEFLVNFTPAEQRDIIGPFLCDADEILISATCAGGSLVEPHIDEARQFVKNYLAIYSQCERDLILEKWRPAFDTQSLSSATESLTPSVTPPGSVTPTALTPREFLSARREVNEAYHHHTPLDFDRLSGY